MKQIIALCSVTLILFMAFINGCSDRQNITSIEKPYVPPETHLTYTTDIKTFLDASCAATCHSAAAHLGNYDLSTYVGVLGVGTDATPNAIAGDESSLLITKLAEGHQSVSSTNQAMIRTWVVDDSLLEAPLTPLTYTTDIKPILDANCVSCHSGGTPAGSYDLSTYSGILGNGTDATPNAIAGDESSELIVRINGNMNSFLGSGADSKISIITRWVVSDSLKQN